MEMCRVIFANAVSAEKEPGNTQRREQGVKTKRLKA
jgi:hypothetical protein